MNSNSHSGKYGSGMQPPNRSNSTNSCPKDSDAESELIDMTDNESCDSFDSYSLKADQQSSQERSTREDESRQLESPKGGHQPPVVPSPVKQMAQQFGSDLSSGPFGGLSSLAMSMFLPPSSVPASSPSSGAFLESMAGSDHLGPHHHYLNALHQQQQQFLFNSSLKLGMEHHHHAASAFRKVK